MLTGIYDGPSAECFTLRQTNSAVISVDLGDRCNIPVVYSSDPARRVGRVGIKNAGIIEST